MKRKTPTTKKAPPSDFKRLKAKVGKSAPKAVNYTDTSFQTAGIKLREQQLGSSLPPTAGIIVPSSNLESFLHQLNHYAAPAARITALKRIQDVLSSSTATTTSTTHASLIPSLSKCAFVDIDSTVRSLGRNLLRFIFSSSSSSTSSSLDPFLPLYVAYISSAFNSLHEDIRNDAPHGVLLATQFFSSDYYKSVTISRLLPSYARLLATSSSVPTKNKNNIRKKQIKVNKAKDRKDGAPNVPNQKISSQRCLILKSLAALFQWNNRSTIQHDKTFGGDKTSSPTIAEHTSTNTKGRECIYYEANTRNAILFINNRHLERQTGNSNSNSNFINHCSSKNILEDLFSCNFSCDTEEENYCSSVEIGSSKNKNESIEVPKNLASSVIREGISDETSLALLNSLIDCWVEVIQRGTSGSKNSGAFLSHVYMEELLDILTCLREFWCQIIQMQNSNVQLRMKVANRIQTHLLESFPVKEEHSNKSSSVYNRFNGSACCLLSELAETGITNTKTAPMVYERILAYIIARLDEIQDVSKNNNGGRASSTKNDNEDECILEAVSVLLLQKKSAESNLLLQSRDRQILLQKFLETFLLLPREADLNEESKDNIRVPAISASTAVGRKATLVACDIILEGHVWFKLEQKQEDCDDDTAKFRILLRKMICVLPYLLKGLGANNPFESSEVLKTIQYLTRRLSFPSAVAAQTIEPSLCFNADFIASVRNEMITILLPRKKKNQLSIFECYPVHLQRSVIGLIGFLKSPRDEITDALAQICARSATAEKKNDAMISYIFEVLFLIRKSIPMASYLNFLIASCSIGAKNLTSATAEKDIFGFDFLAACTSRAIVQSGCSVMLPFLKPVLLGCLKPQPSDDFNNIDISPYSLTRGRAALIILSASAENLRNSSQSIVSFIPELADIVGSLIFDSLLPFASTYSSKSNGNQQARALRPILYLLGNEPKLLNTFVSEALSRLSLPLIKEDKEVTHLSKRRPTKVEVNCLEEMLLNADMSFASSVVPPGVVLESLNEAIRSF